MKAATKAVSLVPEEKADKIVRVSVECEGKTPLLYDKMPQETLLNIYYKRKAAKTAPPGEPRIIADSKIHTDADGKPCVPVKMILACLIAAGQYIRLDGKRQMSTAKGTLLPAFLTIEDKISVPLEASGAEVDIQGGKNATGEAVCVIRPRFDVWAFTVIVQIDTSEISEQTIRQLFDFAGSRIGLGAFRPSRKGIYGTFVVRNWNLL